MDQINLLYLSSILISRTLCSLIPSLPRMGILYDMRNLGHACTARHPHSQARKARPNILWARNGKWALRPVKQKTVARYRIRRPEPQLKLSCLLYLNKTLDSNIVNEKNLYWKIFILN